MKKSSTSRSLPAARVIAILIGAAAILGDTAALAAESAVVFMYHRFGEKGLPATNIRIEQFEAHVAELARPNINVLALPEIISALRAGKPLPERTVGISVDDAFKSVYTNAWPLLRRSGLPFTLFVSTDAVDRKGRGYMTWDQIRELADAGVTIGNQTASHGHMTIASAERNRAEITKSNRRFMDEIGRAPGLFAYPFGETSLAVRQLVIDSGFIAAFGQHSGVLHSDVDFHFLPRFAMNESYGDISRFRLAVNALPLRVREITPADPLLSPAANPPAFGFTVFGDALKGLRALACYASGQGKARIERLGMGRVEVRLKQALPTGRARINCTMPAGGGKWRWFGMQYYMPRN